ncbi:MAG: methylthioribulose 1-phosphate dehydratase [Cyanobacteria bacterium]|nr:methylthioribulose 1-phosphate dehydratase [Cyanobacteriota bacterium]
MSKPMATLEVSIEDSAERQSLVTVVHFLSSMGWTPATSSNFSVRSKAGGFWISVSGLDKSQLRTEDFLRVSVDSPLKQPLPVTDLKPSAETALHEMIYRLYPSANTVVHIHSPNATVLSKWARTNREKIQADYDMLAFEDYEILKGFSGVASHLDKVSIPVFDNNQDMTALVQQIEPVLQTHSPQNSCYGFLLAGHGLYTWGDTPPAAQRHAEVFEFLFDCQLKWIQLKKGV